MASLKTTILVLASAVPSVWSLNINTCYENNPAICLDQVTWCNHLGDCSFPTNERLESRALEFDLQYFVNWLHADSQYPVLLEWEISPHSYYPERKSVTWSRNFTQGEAGFVFRFSEMVKEIPVKDFNVTATEVITYAHGHDIFRISQPEHPEKDFRNSRESFVAFTVIDHDTSLALSEHYSLGSQEMYNKWKLPVGLSFGLGVPLLMAATFFIGLFLGKRRSTRTHKLVPGEAE
ncbi:hypothetical protein HJFPF1_03912 [Paramyrothecium foliicola]|nr:hypothetical protein HJFPF1_03912 [Paramyrothecium foliicola]